MNICVMHLKQCLEETYSAKSYIRKEKLSKANNIGSHLKKHEKIKLNP